VATGRRGDGAAAWEESGLSLSKFADKQGVNVQRLSWWRKQLEERGMLAVVAEATSRCGVVRSCCDECESVHGCVAFATRGGDRVADAAAVPTAWLAAAVKALEGQR